ncbi:Pollen Ole e 1 allergen/extensin [Macleaya cordata]|uniref:Pollen Ole e 1 allergen/extensin n=1 Tax=Macleaya cordata TaxID=56857 RepID=A0A200R5D5_MACCD|nr:Pollen Ole e 1 allergen/extensin [Macleaya cordata]
MGMTLMVVSIMAASILMGCIKNVDSSSSSSEDWKKEKGGKVMIYVGGKVVCQDCNTADWVHGAKPIKGSRVSITCMDDKSKRVMYLGSNKTDGKGEFEMMMMIVNKYMNGKELMTKVVKLCTVKLVSSPNPDCYVPTDFGGGRLGVKLSSLRPSLVQPNLTRYKVGTFSYTTPLCDEPDY